MSNSKDRKRTSIRCRHCIHFCTNRSTTKPIEPGSSAHHSLCNPDCRSLPAQSSGDHPESLPDALQKPRKPRAPRPAYNANLTYSTTICDHHRSRLSFVHSQPESVQTSPILSCSPQQIVHGLVTAQPPKRSRHETPFPFPRFGSLPPWVVFFTLHNRIATVYDVCVPTRIPKNTLAKSTDTLTTIIISLLLQLSLHNGQLELQGQLGLGSS